MEISLDTTYSALSHPIRREILEQLQKGSQLVHQLAQNFNVSSPAISKHLRILEDAQMIQREKQGREQHISLNGQALKPAATYLHQYEAHWERQLDALNEYVKK